jgi:hypothetical protein
MSLPPIKVIDIIHHQNVYYKQIFYIIDRAPVFLYERNGIWLTAEDSGFFNFYYHENPTQYSKAFAGRKFTIPLKDGSCIEANGQWWSGLKPDYNNLLISVSAETPENLGQCNVFRGMWADPHVLHCDISPSNNYNKYDKKHPDYKKHTIESEWKNDGIRRP